MGKGRGQGINLAQLRNELASDAINELGKVKANMNKLKKENFKLQEELKERKEICRFLFNRCFAYSNGCICLICGMKEMCMRKKTV